MPQFRINSPIKHGGKIIRDGDVELSAKVAAPLVARGELSPVREAKPAKTDTKTDTKPDPKADAKADGKAGGK